MSHYRKKMIEVALPLEAINEASAKEKSIRHGHPCTLHLWWARRPLAACRAVLFAQLVDDPSAWPDRFPTEESQEKERERLFRILRELVKWENSNSETVLNAARLEIARSLAHGRKADGKSDTRDDGVLAQSVTPAKVRAYLGEVAPPVYDPFAGGGSIPLEAQRLGLRAYASDLNPVAVMICKALIEIPPRFAGRKPVHPEAQQHLAGKPAGAQGLAEDVRSYGEWIRDEAFRRIGHLYPSVTLPKEHGGGEGTVIAWLWARTVASPNPAFRGIHVPLVSNFFLSTKKGKETWVEPVVEGTTYRFAIRRGKPTDKEAIRSGTKLGRGANFRCILSDTPIEPDYIKAEGKAGRMGARLMAIVAEGNRQRIYLPPTEDMEQIARQAEPDWVPEQALPENPRWFSPPDYGMPTYGDLFTPRQLVALTTFSDLVGEARERVIRDARAAGWEDDGRGFEEGGEGATAYGDAIGVYLAFVVNKLSNYNSSLVIWSSSRDQAIQTFSRQALPMIWDFVEVNPFGGAAGDPVISSRGIARVTECLPAAGKAICSQHAAQQIQSATPLILSTDPPYYDNVGYADLSDFFYVWQRRSLRGIFTDVFSTLLVPKAEELVATPYRHGGADAAEAFFMEGMSRVMHGLNSVAANHLPMTIFYAFKQSESRDGATSSTGWEAFLEGLVRTRFIITGTWPFRTERPTGLKSSVNALASSVVLSCRRRPPHAQTITRSEFRRLLRSELPGALLALQHGNIAPVDLAQAVIGPGMETFSRHETVMDANGSCMSVRSALELIHDVLDEYLTEQEGEVDSDTRFAVTWFEVHGFEMGAYGDAETLAKARNVSVEGVRAAGVLSSSAGKVRLLRRQELDSDWDPACDNRPTAWEATQHLIKRLEEQGETAAADLLSRLGPLAEQARALAYRLYTVCERRGWAEEARGYNSLVIAWNDLEALAAQTTPVQGQLV